MTNALQIHKRKFPPFEKVSNRWIYVTESEAFIFLCYVKLPQTKDMKFSLELSSLFV